MYLNKRFFAHAQNYVLAQARNPSIGKSLSSTSLSLFYQHGPPLILTESLECLRFLRWFFSDSLSHRVKIPCFLHIFSLYQDLALRYTVIVEILSALHGSASPIFLWNPEFTNWRWRKLTSYLDSSFYSVIPANHGCQYLFLLVRGGSLLFILIISYGLQIKSAILLFILCVSNN